MSNTIVLHGGAGSSNQFSERLKAYAKRSLNGKSALDCVISAVVQMEDDQDFNAGTGSVMRVDGSIQMDAAVMIPGRFGAVAAIERVKNPVLVARDVMERTPHLILSGDGAVRFARAMGHRDYDPSTEKARERYRAMMSALEGKKTGEDEKYSVMREVLRSMPELLSTTDTVGAVARVNGEFAAAVSTGGASPMLRGRIGDSPIPGAGIYCGEKGAVVATGIGEEILKRVLCYRVYSRIGAKRLEDIVREEIAAFGNVSVGLIAVSEDEAVAASNTNMAYAVEYF
ncbi:isoaspartyl peptidase/L-asparaginase [Thermogymnomonas acidicola]|uniref:isoaspartyl peptidase/L-asparaginase n=1 Tax=Thermogymnomonas acidicola TaxID=399579 RepID=UPI001668ABB1|nr:isoaspartyl peptidase/L-asparaginase [Thermogymnomonas acidicola]